MRNVSYPVGVAQYVNIITLSVHGTPVCFDGRVLSTCLLTVRCWSAWKNLYFVSLRALNGSKIHADWRLCFFSKQREQARVV